MPNYLPTNDLLFKKIMTSEDSLYILKAFVNDLLGTNFKTLRPRETYHIDSYKRTLQKENGEEICRTEVDILATAEDGSQATTISTSVRCFTLPKPTARPMETSRNRPTSSQAATPACALFTASILWGMTCLMKKSTHCNCFSY